jgi:hypothetical protein
LQIFAAGRAELRTFRHRCRALPATRTARFRHGFLGKICGWSGSPKAQTDPHGCSHHRTRSTSTFGCPLQNVKLPFGSVEVLISTKCLAYQIQARRFVKHRPQAFHALVLRVEIDAFKGEVDKFDAEGLIIGLK